MPQNLLTDVRARQAAVATGEKLLADGDGLYLRIRPNAKSWLFICRGDQGKKTKVALGSYPTHSLKDARVWADEQRRIRNSGVAPVEVKRAKRIERTTLADRTLGKLLATYVTYLRTNKRPSADDVENIFALHVSETIKARPAAAVSHLELLTEIRKLVDQRKLRTSGKLRSYLRAAFELAIRAADDANAPAALMGFGVDVNPVSRIRVTEGSKGNRGERHLSRVELLEYKRQLDKFPEGEIKDFLKLQLLLCGQRIVQLLSATLETKPNSKVLVIRDRKGRRHEPRRHEIPLFGEALQIVERRGKLFAIEDSREIKQAALRISDAVKAISKAMTSKNAEIAPFSASDIRRTAETALSSLHVSKEIRARLLSHGISGVQDAHYDRHSYEVEKASALQAWCNYLATLEETNVIPIGNIAQC